MEEIFANVKESLISFLNRSSELSSSSEDKQHHNPNQHIEPESESIPTTSNDRVNNNSSTSGGGSGSRRPITVSTSNGATGRSSRNSGGAENGNGGHSTNNTKSKYKAGRSNSDSSDTSHASFGDGNGSINTGNSIKDEAIRKIATLKGNFLGPSFYLQEDFLDDAIKTVSVGVERIPKNGDVMHKIFCILKNSKPKGLCCSVYMTTHNC